ncbi:putative membrane protein [Clostridium argentinense CDC 2741]|uniref:Putative membrane protein n=1 Tax=Clostridium argentinense CDC 2741 TaxID=1418104 RepID=A0A0C1R8N4_9CLOT|nr:putative membrane protein [Clostridium argentinense CDC 2741]
MKKKKREKIAKILAAVISMFMLLGIILPLIITN